MGAVEEKVFSEKHTIYRQYQTGRSSDTVIFDKVLDFVLCQMYNTFW